MAKSNREQEQMDLIDVHPKNSKEIIATARQYRQIVQQRTTLTAEEVALKQKLSNLVHGANLQPLNNGIIKFQLDGVEITIIPRDELVKVREINPE